MSLSSARELLAWGESISPGIGFGPGVVARAAYRFDFALVPGRLEKALIDVVNRHDALRAVAGGGVVPHVQLARLTVVELPSDRGSFVPRQLLDLAGSQDHPPGRAPLLWAYLGLHPEASTLLLVAHHSVSDPWSMDLIVRDLMQAYDGSLSTARKPTVETAPDGLDAKLDYWSRQLHGIPEIAIPVKKEPGVRSWFRFGLGPIGKAAIARAGRALRMTPFLTMLAAYKVCLRDLTGVADLAVPVLTYGRNRSQWDEVGLHMNVLVVRTRIPVGLTLRETADRVRTSFAEALAHELPIATLLKRLPETAGSLFTEPGLMTAQFELIELPRHQANGFTRLSLPRDTAPDRPLLPFTGVQWALMGSAADPDQLSGIAWMSGCHRNQEFLEALASAYRDVLHDFIKMTEESR